MEAQADKNQDSTFEKGSGRVHQSIRKMMLNNFLGGLAWGLGTVLGATLVVGSLLWFFSKLDTAPLIGDYINNILNYIQSSR